MIDISLSGLRRCVLPPELIRDNYIIGMESSYEKYLTEFVNLSSTFKKLSNDKEFKLISKRKQSHGESDCYTDDYQLDFKLFGSQSSIYAARNLSPQKIIGINGKPYSVFPLQFEGMKKTITNPLLERYSLDDLLEINKMKKPKFDRNNLFPEGDVLNILKIMECPKNALYFHSDFIFPNSKNDCSMDEILSEVELYMNKCLSNCFCFREQKSPNKDTFLASVVCGFFCIAEWKNKRLNFEEYIPLRKSKTFVEYYKFIEPSYKGILRVT